MVVLVEEMDKLPPGERQAAVPVAGQAGAALIEVHLDTAGRIEGAHERPDIDLPRAVIDHGDLHRLWDWGLGEHRRERPTEAMVRLVRWQHHRERRPRLPLRHRENRGLRRRSGPVGKADQGAAQRRGRSLVVVEMNPITRQEDPGR
jgi:hypothetical protein